MTRRSPALPARASTWALVAVAVSGCAPGDRAAPPAVTVDTLPSGRVVVTNHGRPAWGEGDGWRLVEELRIGSLEGSGPDVFGQVAGLEVDGEGRIHVLDRQAREVRVFGPDGAWLRTLGGPGQGPGELTSPIGVALDGDRLWVADPRNARFTAFAPDGSVSATVSRASGFFTLPWAGGVDRQGRIHDVGLALAVGTPGLPTLIRYDGEGRPADSLLIPEVEQQSILFTRTDGTPVMSMVPPYAPRQIWRFDPDGGIWAAFADRYALHHIAFGGDTTRTVVLEREPPPVAPAERDSVLAAFERLREDMLDDGARPERDPVVPPVKPHLRGIHLDDRGHLWVRAESARDEPPRLDVFDPTGAWLGSVEAPPPGGWADPVIRGDRLYQVVTGELDEQYVVRYRIEGRGG